MTKGTLGGDEVENDRCVSKCRLPSPGIKLAIGSWPDLEEFWSLPKMTIV